MQNSESQSKRPSDPNELSENGRKEAVCWRRRVEKEGQLEELGGDLNQSPEPTRRSKRGETKGDVGRGVMEKGRSARVIEGKEGYKDDPFDYFFPTGVKSTFLSARRGDGN